MHVNPNNNSHPFFNPDELTEELSAIKKDVDEIELNLKSNYNSMIANVTEFKNQLDFYLSTLKDCNQKINFIEQSNRSNTPIMNKVIDLKNKIDNNKKQIELLLRMYELKTKVKEKKK